MNLHRKEKIVNRTFRFVWLAILVTITYRLYNHYKVENIAENKVQVSHSDSNHISAVRPLARQDSIIHEIKSIKKPPVEKVSATSDVAMISLPQQKDSSVVLPAVMHLQGPPKKEVVKKIGNAELLQGPSALFSRVFTIALGKTVPVNVLWAGSGATATYFKLITIKADDIAGERARFTIEDPFHVLLFSQNEYAAHDKIIIEDDKHNLNISVLQVNTKSVVVNVSSPLNESIINRLQRLE